ncbi:hypothetical protein RDABS01_002565 [Bienertia sinuspersici]
MATNLEERWKALTLTEAEDDALVCEEEEVDEVSDQLVALSLVGKLLTNAPFNPEALKNTMRSLWKPTKSLVVREIEDNIFVFQFFLRADREKVLEQGPWSFDGKLLLLKEVKKGEQPAEMAFNIARFWVKAYQIPVDRRRRSMAVAIANKMGKFVDFDGTDPFGYKKYMRFRVDLDISKPLMRGLKVQVGGAQKWVEFKYEKLTDFCYVCGLFGHAAKECSQYDEDLPESLYPYGSWMRASPTRNRFRSEATKEAELKLLEDFKSSVAQSKVKTKLVFNTAISSGDGGTGRFKEKAKGGVNGDVVMENVAGNQDQQEFCEISTTETDGDRDERWRLTGFYGWPDNSDKHLSWELLRSLKEDVEWHGAWLCVGDFNQILYDEEKLGGPKRSQCLLDGFKHALEDCDLLDIGYTGFQYTWWNGRDGDQSVHERLDRMVGDSDHIPLKLMEYKDVVDDVWHATSVTAPGLFPERLNKVGRALKEWSKREFGSIQRLIKDKNAQLIELSNRRPTLEDCDEYRKVLKEVDDLLLKEEIYWRQRSRCEYLVEGDKNTSFFHMRAKLRKRRNLIKGIKNNDGAWVSEEQQIREVAVQYFKELFTSTKPGSFDEAFNGLEPRVSPAMNDVLCAPFSKQEIHDALFQMKPSKSPGP